MRFKASLWLMSAALMLLLAHQAKAYVPERALVAPSGSITAAERNHDGKRAAAPADCRRWRVISHRLGETYAGYRVRNVVARACAFTGTETSEDEVWQWPWRDPDMRADLPPRHHGQFGAWEIRCGNAGRRQRCVLAHEDVMHEADDPEARALRVVSHFVIDTVAGRESVIWHVHVGLGDGAGGGIAVTLASRKAADAFSVCGKRGCIAESDTRRSAEIANWLWDGKPMSISLGPDGPSQLTAVLPALGFRNGLAELVRLRRQEGRALAGR